MFFLRQSTKSATTLNMLNLYDSFDIRYVVQDRLINSRLWWKENKIFFFFTLVKSLHFLKYFIYFTFNFSDFLIFFFFLASLHLFLLRNIHRTHTHTINKFYMENAWNKFNWILLSLSSLEFHIFFRFYLTDGNPFIFSVMLLLNFILLLEIFHI